MLELKVGIDFGSANITICAYGRGIIRQEPSVVLCDRYSGEILYIGEEAKRLSEKAPGSMIVYYPIKDGVINDPEIARILLKKYLDEACSGRLLKPSVLISISENVSDIEKKALGEIVEEAGAGKVYFVKEALAAAAGAGINMSIPRGTMICDIGGGTTECAVITLGDVAVSKSIRVGGNDFTKLISDYILREHNIEIGAATAEEIKKNVGTAVYRNEEVAMIAAGKNRTTGFPVLFEITSTEIYWVLKSQTEEILQCIKDVLSQTPPELIADIADNGLVLSGGTANLYGLDRFLEWNTGIPTRRAKAPEDCAALGLGVLLRNLKKFEGSTVLPTEEEDDEDYDY